MNRVGLILILFVFAGWSIPTLAETLNWMDAKVIAIDSGTEMWEEHARSALDEPLFKLVSRESFDIPFNCYLVLELKDDAKAISPAVCKPTLKTWVRVGFKVVREGNRIIKLLPTSEPVDMIFSLDQVNLKDVQLLSPGWGSIGARGSCTLERKTLNFTTLEYSESNIVAREVPKMSFDHLSIAWHREELETTGYSYRDAIVRGWSKLCETLDCIRWQYYAEGIVRVGELSDGTGSVQMTLTPTIAKLRFEKGWKESRWYKVKVYPVSLNPSETTIQFQDDLQLCEPETRQNCIKYLKGQTVLLNEFLKEQRSPAHARLRDSAWVKLRQNER